MITYGIATRQGTESNNADADAAAVHRIAWRLPTTEERSRGVRGSVAYVQNSELLNEHLGAPEVLPNVWLGVSVENQQWAKTRIPALLETPAAVRFISAEPLLGPVSLRRLQVRNRVIDCLGGDVIDPSDGAVLYGTPSVLDWVIVGGESGTGARLMDDAWVRSLIFQCEYAHASVFVKQLGSVWASDTWVTGKSIAALGDRKGGDWSHWPVDLRIREFPTVAEEVSVHG